MTSAARKKKTKKKKQALIRPDLFFYPACETFADGSFQGQTPFNKPFPFTSRTKGSIWAEVEMP